MSKNISGNNSQIIIYQTADHQTKLDVRFEGDTVWLTQNLIAELFQTSADNISLHLKNIFAEKELDEASTTEDYSVVRQEGQRQVKRKLKHYNLDAIISVGYRVQSHVATRFRQWATRHIREYIVKGFVLDDERLKNPDAPFDYFDELLRRIQDIRTSEKRFYQKITDIYATSVDYDPTLETSITFFKTVQNKLHWAIMGQTAAEIIKARVDANSPNMGLTNFRGEKPRKQDVAIAKNYLNENELLALNNLVEQYLVFAEGQAMRRIPMTMQDWIKKLDGFLSLNDRKILTHAGNVSHEMAKQIAEQAYDQFHLNRIKQSDNIEGDFEKAIQGLPDHNDHH
jgi:hypothetical protein